MKKQFKIIEDLTPAQKAELDKDIQELYLILQKKPDFLQGRVKDVNTDMNLLDEVFLNITVEFGEKSGDKVKGRITQIHQYPNKSEYIAAKHS